MTKYLFGGHLCGGRGSVMFNALNMEPNTVVIPVRNQQRALEWNLVLASQGIGSAITQSAEPAGWGLAVGDTDVGRALSVLREYHQETRGWKWHQEVPGTGLVFHSGALAWGIGLLLFHFVVATFLGRLKTIGVMDNVAYHAGEWWRLFTSVTLHADASHIAANAILGTILLGFAMARFGSGLALLASLLAGVAGNLLDAVLYSHPYHGLGASGMVMGALGMLTTQSVGHWRQGPYLLRHIVTGLFAGVMLFLILGSDPGSDLIAHLGGFVSGGVLGVALAFVPIQRLMNRRWNATCVTLFLGITGLTWWLALRTL